MIFIVSNMKEYENEKNCEITLPTNFAEWIENAVWINTHLSRFQISRCEVVDTVDKAQLRQFVVGLQKVWKLKYMKAERERESRGKQSLWKLYVIRGYVFFMFTNSCALKIVCAWFFTGLTVLSWSLSNDSIGTPAADIFIELFMR